MNFPKLEQVNKDLTVDFVAEEYQRMVNSNHDVENSSKGFLKITYMPIGKDKNKTECCVVTDVVDMVEED